jgi:hypothetical protein
MTQRKIVENTILKSDDMANDKMSMKNLNEAPDIC